jgi:uncharacterized protein (TIGR03086 family)
MTVAPVDQLATALGIGEGVVAAVRDDQWELPTPCGDWTVRDLVHHIAGGNRFFADILTGAPPPPVPRRPSDFDLGDDLVAAYRRGAEALLAACRRPGFLDETVTVPIGQMPAVAAVRLRLVETMVHSWDLARAIRVPVAFPDELVADGVSFTGAWLSKVPPGRTPFGPPQPVGADATPLDRLAAQLGRSVQSGS